MKIKINGDSMATMKKKKKKRKGSNRGGSKRG